MTTHQETLPTLSKQSPIRIPHVWAGSFSGTVCGDAQVLREWIRVSGSFAASVDSTVTSRLKLACDQAKVMLGMASLPVSFGWSPFPEVDASRPDKTHPAGLWDNNDVMLPPSDAKWTTWENHWKSRMGGWVKQIVSLTKDFGLDFVRPTVVVDAEAFRRWEYAGITRGLSVESDWDAALKAIYGRAAKLAEDCLVGPSLQIWYSCGDCRRKKATWEWSPYWPINWRPSFITSPVCYTVSDVREMIERYKQQWQAEGSLSPKNTAPFWTCCGEWLPNGFTYEPKIDRVKYPHVRGDDVAWGAFLASEHQRGNLHAAVTWPGPGTSNCDPVAFAERWCAMASGANVGVK